jgi:tripeptidyl-peptidase-1
VHFVLEQDTLPTVMSTSYGLDEAAISAEMAYKLCDAYASLTAQGVSILFSTGDSGVGASRGDCTGQPFVPKFPVSCP